MFGIFSGLLDLVAPRMGEPQHLVARDAIDSDRRKARAELSLSCEKCGGELVADKTVMLMSSPPRFNAKCKKCGAGTTVLA